MPKYLVQFTDGTEEVIEAESMEFSPGPGGVASYDFGNSQERVARVFVHAIKKEPAIQKEGKQKQSNTSLFLG